MADLAVRRTAIDGLLVVDLPVHADARGWFKEGWQRAKMTALGLPPFTPVQQNLSHNLDVGATRGIHAEPWDKLVTLATGRVFAAWVDLREGPGFGTVVTLELGVDRAVYVPRGVGNSYQALEPGTTYTYLVNAHWDPAALARYTYLNLFDPALGIDWPIGREGAELSAADAGHPPLRDVTPVPRPRPLVLGAGGQLGRALLRARPAARGLTRDGLDITDAGAVAALDLSDVSAVVNAAAWTAVDAAETTSGRRGAWAANAAALTHLTAAARTAGIPLVHVSTDYIFDGTVPVHDEDEPAAPLSVYGQTKAAGEHVVATWERHYNIRTSWLIGDGGNFVATMARLARQGARPEVVDDQFGRLTFAEDLAAGIWHLLDAGAPFGTYHLSNGGPTMTWADVARLVFAGLGRDPGDVVACSTAAWAAGRPVATRPRHSTLSLTRLEATGFTPPPAHGRLFGFLDRF